MLHIKIVQGINNQTFAPQKGISLPRKKYLPKRGTILHTRFEMGTKVRMIGAFGDDFFHTYIGEYCLFPENGLPNKTVQKSLKRDIKAFRNARVTQLQVLVNNIPYSLSVLQSENLYDKFINLILTEFNINLLTHKNKQL